MSPRVGAQPNESATSPRFVGNCRSGEILSGFDVEAVSRERKGVL